jgi:hypothetical protein
MHSQDEFEREELTSSIKIDGRLTVERVKAVLHRTFPSKQDDSLNKLVKALEFDLKGRKTFAYHQWLDMKQGQFYNMFRTQVIPRTILLS